MVPRDLPGRDDGRSQPGDPLSRGRLAPRLRSLAQVQHRHLSRCGRLRVARGRKPVGALPEERWGRAERDAVAACAAAGRARPRGARGRPRALGIRCRRALSNASRVRPGRQIQGHPPFSRHIAGASPFRCGGAPPLDAPHSRLARSELRRDPRGGPAGGVSRSDRGRALRAGAHPPRLALYDDQRPAVQ